MALQAAARTRKRWIPSRRCSPTLAILNSSPTNRVKVPISAFYVQAGYLLTGETRSSVGIVKPLHPFNPKHDQFGIEHATVQIEKGVAGVCPCGAVCRVQVSLSSQEG